MLNFVLCDDNLNILNKVSKMLEAILIQNELSGQILLKTHNPYEILNILKNKYQIDVLIVDIDLKSNINGIDLVNKIRKYNKLMYVIFVTAHLEYGILAYQCKTFDFLSKPITLERLEETIFRLYNDAAQLPNTFIKIDCNIIREDNIFYIKKDGMKLIFKTKSQDFETTSSLTDILNSLPSNFIRCHKSYVVNIKNIIDIKLNNNIIVFNTTTTIKCYIGPSYKNSLMKGLNDYGIFKFNLELTNNSK